MNLAARLEASGEAGKVHVSESIYLRLAGENTNSRDEFLMHTRGQIEIKGFGSVKSWFMEPAASKESQCK